MAAELKRCKQITYCKFCKALGNKVKCVWQAKYPPAYKMYDYYKHYACEEHKHLIEDTDPNRTRKPSVPSKQTASDYMTEADYQTWGKL